MKLIIDISEDVYAECLGDIYFPDTGGELFNAVKNGTPLDDVRAEIEKQIKRDFAFAETETLKVPCHYGIANGLQNAIRFLDNISKAEREEP